MPIPVRCQCGQSFQAKDSMGGKTAKCPKCGQPILIPSPPVKAAPSSAAAGMGGGSLDDLFDEIGLAPPIEGPRCPSCNESLKPGAVICVACGTNLHTGERYQTHFDDDEAGPSGEKFGNRELDRAARSMAEEKVLQDSLTTGAPWWVLLLALLGLIAFITGMLLIPKSLVMFVTASLLLGVGGLMTTVTGIWILVLAFKDTLAQGLLCVFVPFYMIYYAVVNWDDIGGIFTLWAAGTGMQIFGYVLLMVAAWLADKSDDDPYSRIPVSPPAAVATSLAGSPLPTAA